MQIVIVGAGPTGVTLALLLVKRGIAVTLIEAAKDFHRVFRGEGLMPSGLDALEQMGSIGVVRGYSPSATRRVGIHYRGQAVVSS
ncbi:hypothetical protein NSTCB13_04724 [Nostoc sp. DSM 114160]